MKRHRISGGGRKDVENNGAPLGVMTKTSVRKEKLPGNAGQQRGGASNQSDANRGGASATVQAGRDSKKYPEVWNDDSYPFNEHGPDDWSRDEGDEYDDEPAPGTEPFPRRIGRKLRGLNR